MLRTLIHRVPCLLALTVFICLIFCGTGVTQTSIPEPLLFSGNATVVAPPLANSGYAFGPNQFASLARREDCSMTAVLAELVPPSVQLLQNDYQNNLHQHAGLTTKGTNGLTAARIPSLITRPTWRMSTLEKLPPEYRFSRS